MRGILWIGVIFVGAILAARIYGAVKGDRRRAPPLHQNGEVDLGGARTLKELVDWLCQVCPTKTISPGYVWSVSFSADPGWMAVKDAVFKAARRECGELLLQFSDTSALPDDVSTLGLSVSSDSPELWRLERAVDYAKLSGAGLEFGGWCLFHPLTDESAARYLASTPWDRESHANLIRAGVADFLIYADLDDYEWWIAMAPAIRGG
jgi:hypothetical protein